jgi:hypothetical protein
MHACRLATDARIQRFHFEHRSEAAVRYYRQILAQHAAAGTFAHAAAAAADGGLTNHDGAGEGGEVHRDAGSQGLLVPFLIGFNKVYFTHLEFAARYQEAVVAGVSF